MGLFDGVKQYKPARQVAAVDESAVSFPKWLDMQRASDPELALQIRPSSNAIADFEARNVKKDHWYWITVGMKGVRYTVRTLWWDTVQTGDFAGSTRLRNQHSTTLGKEDYPRMLQKALDVANGKPIVYTRETLRKRAAARSSYILRFGKYAGREWDSIAADDPGYAAWLINKMREAPEYARRKKMAKRLVKYIADQLPTDNETYAGVRAELDKIAARQKAYEQRQRDRAERRAKLQAENAAMQASGQYVAPVGGQVTVGAEIVRVSSFEAPSYGYHGGSVMRHVYTMLTHDGNLMTYITSSGPWLMKGKAWKMAHEAHGLPVVDGSSGPDEFMELRELDKGVPFESHQFGAMMLRPGAIVCVRGRVKRHQVGKYAPFEGVKESLLTRATIKAYAKPGSDASQVCKGVR
jgi:hypothetical protein